MASTKRRAPADLVALVRDFLSPRIAAGARLCLGYSGGLDSSVLLHILAGLRQAMAFQLTAVHVHHGLSTHADAWAEACRQVCEGLGVPLAIRHVEVAAEGLGLEAAARAARYRAYAEQEADAIVLAHHQDDQAETVLFRLLRGAGVQGLAGMAATRSHDPHSIWRPLLDVQRDRLSEYAVRNGIGFVDDDSNADVGLTRNWLRHEVFPLLETRFPGARRVLARTAGQLAESAGLLAELAEIDLDAARAGDGLALPVLMRLSRARTGNLLRHWLHGCTGQWPSRAWLDETLDQLLTAGSDRHPAPLWGGWRLLRRAGRVILAEQPAVPMPEGVWYWQGESELVLSGHGRLLFMPATGVGLAADSLARSERARVTWRQGGERLRPDCQRPSRTLKNLLREAAVPVDDRQALPLLWVGTRLVWAAGIGVDCAAQAAPGQPGWLISWCPRDR